MFYNDLIQSMSQRAALRGVLFVGLFLLGGMGPVWAALPLAESVIVRLQTGMSLQSHRSPMEQLKKRYPNANVWVPKAGASTAALSRAATVLVSIPEGMDPEAMAAALSKESWVVQAEPNYPVVAMTTRDPLRYLQGHLYANRLAQLKDLVAYREVLVAVLDSGIDYYHEDLKDQIQLNSQEIINGVDDDHNGFVDDLYGYDFYGFYKGDGHANPNDGLGHGTHVAGIIGAKSGNQVGVEGVAAYVKLLNVRFLDDRGFGNQYDAAVAIRYAVDMGAKIINCSWGYFRSTSVLEEALNYAFSRGVIVVAAAGNSGSRVAEYPAAYPGVVSVGAITLADTKTYFSSFGKVDTAMYGDAIYSTLPNNRYGSMSGTSQSTGVVTGILARLMAHFPEATSGNIHTQYFAACTHSDPSAGVGKGIFSTPAFYTNSRYDPNAHSQSNLSVLPVDISGILSVKSNSLAITKLHSFPNPHVTTTAYIGFESSHSSVLVTVKIFDLEGRLLRTLGSVASRGYNRLPWDLLTDTGGVLKNGSYLYVLEATSGDDTEIKRGRFAVLL